MTTLVLLHVPLALLLVLLNVRDQLFQLLMHLTLEFESISGNILHRSPLPSPDVVVVNLTSDETRLCLLSPQHNIDPFFVLDVPY